MASLPTNCHTKADGSGNAYTVSGGICNTMTSTQKIEIIIVSIVLGSITVCLGAFILIKWWLKQRSYKITTKAIEQASPEMRQSMFYGSHGSKARMSVYSTMSGSSPLAGGQSRRGSYMSTTGSINGGASPQNYPPNSAAGGSNGSGQFGQSLSPSYPDRPALNHPGSSNSVNTFKSSGLKSSSSPDEYGGQEHLPYQQQQQHQQQYEQQQAYDDQGYGRQGSSSGHGHYNYTDDNRL